VFREIVSDDAKTAHRHEPGPSSIADTPDAGRDTAEPVDAVA